MLILMFLWSVAYVSLCEYLLHRLVMHHPIGPFRYPFKAHALTHHRIFKADETYHLMRAEDKQTIPMAWWNGPVLLVIAAIIPSILSLLLDDWWILATSTSVGALYYGAYEYTHWCMHLPRPKKRLMERLPVIGWMFYRLNGHHLLHHRYMGKNFNVVLPFWDLCLGSLLVRSKKPFDQARGPSVPDVQPKTRSPLSAG